MVTVEADPQAAPLPPGLPDQEKEKIIQSWTKVAVLRLTAEVPARLAFFADGHAEFLTDPIKGQEGLFGVHVGPKDTTFLALPDDNQSPTKLELVEVTDLDDPRYPDLPLY